MAIPRKRRFLPALLLFCAACVTTELTPGPPPAKPPPEPIPMEPTQALLRFYAHVLETYRGDIGGYPESLEELYRPSEGLATWKGPYLDGDPPPLDAWSRPVVYRRRGAGFSLASAGEDGRVGTADDLTWP